MDDRIDSKRGGLKDREAKSYKGQKDVKNNDHSQLEETKQIKDEKSLKCYQVCIYDMKLKQNIL